MSETHLAAVKRTLADHGVGVGQASAWASTDLDVQGITKWVQAGCRDPSLLRLFRQHGLTPADLSEAIGHPPRPLVEAVELGLLGAARAAALLEQRRKGPPPPPRRGSAPWGQAGDRERTARAGLKPFQRK